MTQLLKKAFSLFSLVALSFLLSACGSGKTMVLESMCIQEQKRSLRIERDQNTAPVELEIANRFENSLSFKLFEEHKMLQGNDIVLKYRFIQYNEGSRFGRWMFGGLGNTGEGSLTVEVRFLDMTQGGKEIGRIHSEGKIGSGFFGGSIDNAIDCVTHEVTEYTLRAFKPGYINEQKQVYTPL
jgi:hypothetical protein